VRSDSLILNEYDDDDDDDHASFMNIKQLNNIVTLKSGLDVTQGH